MKVWMDLSNSPHPLFFAPIARALEGHGHAVVVTARNHAQTIELAQARWPAVHIIGGESPKGRTAKVVAIGGRVRELRRWAEDERPTVALSHNSYAQIVAARTLALPAVTAMDFEHQPASHIAFRLAQTILLPEPLAIDAVRRQGATPGKVQHYPGLKEELYIGDFAPAGDILARLGIERGPETVVVVARTPPSRATYHRFANSLFGAALEAVCSHPNVICVALARHPEEAAELRGLALSRCVVPSTAIDSRSLIYAADLMIGAGGTMTREAALLGIPTWTLFSGVPPAVDLWLERAGMLCRLESVDQLRVAQRISPPRPLWMLAARAAAIEQVFVDAIIRAGREPPKIYPGPVRDSSLFIESRR